MRRLTHVWVVYENGWDGIDEVIAAYTHEDAARKAVDKNGWLDWVRVPLDPPEET